MTWNGAPGAGEAQASASDIPGAGVEAPRGEVAIRPTPAEAARPLWYRAAGAVEPLRPAFAWAVEHEWAVRLGGIVAVAVPPAFLIGWLVSRYRGS